MGLNFSGNVQTPQKSSIKGSARKAAKKWVSNPESVRVPKRKPSNLFGLLKKKKINFAKEVHNNSGSPVKKFVKSVISAVNKLPSEEIKNVGFMTMKKFTMPWFVAVVVATQLGLPLKDFLKMCPPYETMKMAKAINKPVAMLGWKNTLKLAAEQSFKSLSKLTKFVK
ncbi:MAG: hypothetical protein ACI4CY_01320 [Candidatus Gastranaerophilaceae bacterium]